MRSLYLKIKLFILLFRISVKYPELRLGQLINSNNYYAEDDEFYKQLKDDFLM